MYSNGVFNLRSQIIKEWLRVAVLYAISNCRSDFSGFVRHLFGQTPGLQNAAPKTEET